MLPSCDTQTGGFARRCSCTRSVLLEKSRTSLHDGTACRTGAQQQADDISERRADDEKEIIIVMRSHEEEHADAG